MYLHRVVAFMVTQRCPLRCRHCGASSGPEAGVEAAVEDVLDWLQAAAKSGMNACGLTGGEPFLVRELLVAVSRWCSRSGVRCGVVTSGYWAGDDARADRAVAGLSGLEFLDVSTDVFHQEFVPLDAALRALAAARRAGIPRLKATVAYGRRLEAEEIVRAIKAFDGGIEVEVLPLSPIGRALGLKPGELEAGPVPEGPCRVVRSALVGPDGSVYACCGIVPWDHPAGVLRLGSLAEEPFDRILRRAAADPLVWGLATLGPRRLGRMAGDGVDARTCLGMCDYCFFLLRDPERVAFLRRAVRERGGTA